MSKSLIKTDRSFLSVRPLDNKELIRKCIDDVEDKLLENPKIHLYGKEAVQHRSIGFFSDESVGYYYSNQLAESQPLTDNLKDLLGEINSRFGAEFNGILVNKYGDGNDYIGAHSDNEKDLSDVGVVSISYGATRKFRIRDKITKKIVMDVPTNEGEIMCMGGDFQKEFTHEIPVEKKVKEARISLTFRKHNK